ncbi:RrF2 family transcriptional regulator [Kocuria sp.]|uniref:RrF2 family transcriptional regulator n=1 Tax=Kocuria sp. TaxID=1871328 RepID=UPI0026E07334|nr:Rrf2 family transcriptional regulator [Kocuria sp.]MDO5617487.1 Rrf2 family transcriptional regulator [Kocuria sp.]
MEISARSEYAIRALLMLAEAHAGGVEALPVATLAQRQELPAKFLEVVMGQLRRGGLVVSKRGAAGGYRLAAPADEMTIGAVIRTVDGPLTGVRGMRPSDTEYAGAATHLPVVWVAVRAALRSVLDEVTLEDVLTGHFPDQVAQWTQEPGAWEDRWPLQASAGH